MRILSGIQPSGALHLGNYFGMMKPSIELQDKGQAYYFIADYHSMTSLFDASITDERNPRRFVDAMSIPYVVLPSEGFNYAKLGDFATVVNLRNGKVEGAIIADESSSELPMGEGSIALARALGIDSDPRSGGVEKGIVYVIYPNSGDGKPRALDEIVSASQAHFKQWGGFPRLRGCLNE